MAVSNPELNFTPYKPDPANAPQVPQINPPTQPNPTEGYIPKSGAVAHVVTDALRGWMQGREIARQNAEKKAQQNIQIGDYAYKTMADNYNSLLKSGKAETDPEVVKAKQAAVAAWQARNQVLQQYVAPEPQAKPKGAGGKVKAAGKAVGNQMFGSVTPQMIPQAAMAILKNSPPPGLGLTPEDKEAQTRMDLEKEELKGAKTNNEAGTLKLEQEKKDAEAKTKWTNLSQIPVDKQTPAQKQELQMLDTIMTGPVTPDKKLEYDTAAAVSANKELTPSQRQIAYGKGWLQAPQVLQTQDGLTNNLKSIDPTTGKVLWTVKVGHQFHEDQASAAGRIMQAQQQGMFDLYTKANPKMAAADIWNLVSADMSRNPQLVKQILGSDPQQTEQQDVKASKAMKAIMSGYGADKRDDQAKIWSNWVVADPSKNGEYFFPGTIKSPETKSHWFGKDTTTYSGGLDPDKFRTETEARRNTLAGVLRLQNPKDSPQEIQAIVDRVIPRQETNSGPQQMSAPPSAGGPQQMSPPPGSSDSDPLSLGIQ